MDALLVAIFVCVRVCVHTRVCLTEHVRLLPYHPYIKLSRVKKVFFLKFYYYYY